MSPPKPPNVHAESLDELQKHLATARKRATALEKRLAAEVHVDTIEEARVVFATMVNDAHVLNLKAERSELEFVLRRIKDINVDIANFKEPA